MQIGHIKCRKRFPESIPSCCFYVNLIQEDDVVIEEETDVTEAQTESVTEEPSNDVIGDEDDIVDLENCLAEADDEVSVTAEVQEEVKGVYHR